jgi:hypothetical protein
MAAIMDIGDIEMIARILARPVAWLIAGGILFLMIGLTVHSCSKARQAGAEASLSNETGKAVSDSGKDAVGAVEAVSGRNSAIDEITRENADEIRKAEGADALVNPAAHGAGLDSLCRRAAYRCTEQCLQRAVARGVAKPGTGCPSSRR